MKKITRIITAAFATVAFAACQQEMQEISGENSLPLNQFGASAEVSTKVTISSDWKLSWEAGDQTDVFDGSNKLLFSAKSAGASTILDPENKDFKRDLEKTYYAVYPAADANSIDGTTISLNVAGDRTAVAGEYPAAPAVANTTGAQANFGFMNVCGLVSFEVAEGQNIASIVIFGGNGENVAGTVKVNALTAEYEVVKGEKEITLTPAEGETFAAGRYYVAVLPQEFTSGLSVSLYAADGTRLRKNLNAFTLGRSSHLDVETGGEFKTEYTIKNADELVAFLALADKCSSATKATLANDIDLSGVTLKPASSYAGTFDGNGKSLMNWTTDGPLFTKIVAGATVNGIVLDASCTLKIKEQNTKPAGFVVAENEGTVSGCTNKADITYTRSANLRYRQFGTIVGVSTGLVSDCHNEGNISITIPKLDYAKGNGNNYQHQIIGGVVGAFVAESGKESVTGCTNAGDITFVFKGTSVNELRPHMVIGGVCGLAGKSSTTDSETGVVTVDNFVACKSTNAVNNGTIKNCTNTGALTFNYEGMIGGGYSLLGGVIGYIEGSVDACVNNGPLNLIGGTDSNTSLGAPALGGVVAAVVAGDVKNCSNTAAVHMQGKCQGGTDDAAYAGGMKHLCVGGVVGKIGAYKNEVTTYSVSDSKNSGAVSVKTGATPIVHVGGVVGWAAVPVNGTAANKLENNGTISILPDSDMSELYVGGVIGRTISTYDKIYNASGGDLTVNVTSARECVTYIGGVAGFMEKVVDATTAKQGINKGDVNVSGGLSTSTKRMYVGGVIAKTMAKKISSNGTGWAQCNSNYGNITVNSQLTMTLGGVLAELNAATSTGFSGSTSQLKYQGVITVTNPGKDSYIGGVVGAHGRGQLGNANGFGESDTKIGKIDVTGADATTYVGGYVGYLKTDNGAGTTISGCGFRGEISAEGATAGVLAGYVGMTGASNKNVIKLGSAHTLNEDGSIKSSERPKISKNFKFNGDVVGDFSLSTVVQSQYFGKIAPSTSEGNTVAGQYFFQTAGVDGNLDSFKDGLLNL